MPHNASVHNFEIEQQLMSQWCWAAVAVSVRRCYDTDFAVTQPQFASAMLQMPQCQQSPFSECDQRFSLQVALDQLGVFRDKLEEPCTPEVIAAEIKNDLVIGCQLVQNGFDGHYIVIKGVGSGNGQNLLLEIADPLDGASRFITLRQLLFDYNNAQWEQTFFTKRLL